jgi:hypothetical protein
MEETNESFSIIIAPCEACKFLTIRPVLVKDGHEAYNPLLVDLDIPRRIRPCPPHPLGEILDPQN